MENHVLCYYRRSLIFLFLYFDLILYRHFNRSRNFTVTLYTRIFQQFQDFLLHGLKL